MIIRIDGSHHKTKQDLHESFLIQGDFPTYYGKNLDALYDCLTQSKEEILICFLNETELLEKDPAYMEPFIQTLMDAQTMNRNIKLQWE